MKPINELFKLSDVWLDELYDRLWYEYWCPLKPHTKELKTFIREQLNTIANIWNKDFGSDSAASLKVVKATDTWEDDGQAPQWSKAIYVEVRPETEKPKVAMTAKPRQQESTRKTSPCLVGKKGTYDEVAKLADEGKNKDEIQAITGFARKFITDSLWRWNKNKTK